MDEIENVTEKEKKDGSESEIRLQTPFGPITLDAEKAMGAWSKTQKDKSGPTNLAQAYEEGYIGGSTGGVSKFWPQCFGEKVMLVLDDYISCEWETERISHFIMRGNKEVMPNYRIVEAGEGGTKDIPIEAVRLICRKDDPQRRMVLVNSLDHDGDIRLTAKFSKENRGLAKVFLDNLEDFFFENGPMRGTVFDGNMTFLPRHSGASERLIMAKGVREKVSRHLTGFLSVMHRAEEFGIPSNRGVILSGPPGTGKTLLVRYIIEKTDLTVICLSPSQIKRGTISTFYRMARKLGPCLVVLEDIDSAGGLHRKIRDHPILGEVLESLDGISDNAGVVTLATTNYLENIDDALRDRPGRFDRIIQVPVPDADSRRMMIEKMGPEFGIGGWLDADWLSNETVGFTGDWLRNLMQTSKLIALQRGSEEIAKRDLEEALVDIDDNRMIAYQSTPELPRPDAKRRVSQGSYA